VRIVYCRGNKTRAVVKKGPLRMIILLLVNEKLKNKVPSATKDRENRNAAPSLLERRVEEEFSPDSQYES
jgi:hypothetical protein